MKHSKSEITTIALSLLTALALPAAGMAQSQSQSGSQQAQDTQQSAQRDRGAQSEAPTVLDDSIQIDTDNSMSTQVSKVTEDSLENKVTADRLIGKTVVDSEGNKIGTVKDVGLSDALSGGSERIDTDPLPGQGGEIGTLPSGAAGASEAQQAAGSAQIDRSAGQSQAAGAQSGSAGARPGPNPSAELGEAGYTIGSTDASAPSSRTETDARDAGQPDSGGELGEIRPAPVPSVSKSDNGDVNLYISSEEGQLLEVPASMASLNDDEDQVELDITQEEIDSIPEPSSLSAL